MSVYSGPDVASQKMLAALEQAIADYKTVDLELASADGDKESAVQAFMESSDDPTVVKLRDQISKLNAKLNEYAEQNAVVVTLSEDEKKKKTEERELLKTRIRKGRSVVEDVASTMGIDFDNVMQALNTLGDPTKSNKGRAPGSKGSGLPRISASLTILDVDDNGDKDLIGRVFTTFSAFAMKFSCDVKDIQLAFAEAAGVPHDDIKSVTEPVEFVFQPNSNGAVYVLKTTPKERASRKDSKDSKPAEVTEQPETVNA